MIPKCTLIVGEGGFRSGTGRLRNGQGVGWRGAEWGKMQDFSGWEGRGGYCSREGYY